MTAPDAVSELAHLAREITDHGECVVLPPAVTEQLVLRALAFRAALGTTDRVLSPSLVDFLGQ